MVCSSLFKKEFIKPEDVLILYFQREGSEIVIYPIKVDKMGNVIDPPKGYRDFFLEEEKRFFGVKV